MDALNEFWPATSLQAWREQPQRAFEDWLAGRYVPALVGRMQQFRPTSVKTYGAMFNVWCGFLVERQMHLLEASPKEAAEFFEQKELLAVSRRRYLQLLDRVYQHLRAIGLAHGSPFSEELAKERVLDMALPPGLDEFEQELLCAHLEQLPGWKGARDRAMAALLLGAGLRTNEAVSLPTSAVASDFSVTVHPSGVHLAHHSLILPEGDWRSWWSQWLAFREELQAQQKPIPGPTACPATAKGKPYSPSGLFRRVSDWFEACGLTPEQRGPNILRNTFARNAFLSGRYELEQVQQFLGHAQSRATQKHMQALQESGLVKN